MGKTAIVFPGQGAQYVGMGQGFAENFPVSKKVFEAASQAMGYSMEDLCFRSSDEDLRKTENTQPSILTTCIAIYKALEDKGIKADGFAGLSLGEYAALVAAGAMPFENAVKVVRKRGQYMQEEVPMGVGGMAAILGLANDKVIEACEKASATGVVEPANFNCPAQLVIAGEVGAVEKAVEICKEMGAKKAIMLPVSAPFHTSMLKGAGEKLALELDNVTFSPLNKPVVGNVEADFISSETEIKDLLIRQVSNPVRWEESIQRMINDGYDTFIEVGPGKSLSKFIKRISKDVQILNVEDPASLDKTLEKLGA